MKTNPLTPIKKTEEEIQQMVESAQKEAQKKILDAEKKFKKELEKVKSEAGLKEQEAHKKALAELEKEAATAKSAMDEDVAALESSAKNHVDAATDVVVSAFQESFSA